MKDQKRSVVEHSIIFTLFGIGIGFGLQTLLQLTGAEFTKTQLAIILTVAGIIATATGIKGRQVSKRIYGGGQNEE